MMNALLTAFLFMGTTVSDSGQALPLPLSTADTDSLSQETAMRTINEVDTLFSRTADRSDSSTGPTPQPGSYPIYRLLTPDKLNIETLETAALDDDGSEISRSVHLNEHEQKMGLGWLIPGGLMGFFGLIICTVAFDSQLGETMDTNDLAPMLSLGGTMMLGGGCGISIGIYKLRKHSRWHNRYHHSMRDLNTKRVVFSAYVHP